jgi:hypothetical protein
LTDAVAHFDGLLLGGEGLHGHQRTEHFFLDDLVVLVDAVDDGGGVEKGRAV